MIVRALTKLLLILSLSVSSAFLVYRWMHPQNHLLFENSDFEKGSLKNWLAEGAAFESQPTLGDNPLKRGQTLPTKFQGKYWVGTYEKHPDAAALEGTSQNEIPMGRLTSIPFTIRKSKIAFLDGAGIGTLETSVSLIVAGQTVLAHSPTGFLTSNEVLSPVVWDVTPWLNKQANIVIIDQSSGAWGHINADNFHYA